MTTMQESRTYMRLNIPIILQFRPNKGVLEYSWGLTKDISYDGLSFESLNFDLKPREDLELNLKFPEKGTVIPVQGNLIWKQEYGRRCLAGVKLTGMDKEEKNVFIHKVASYTNKPVDWFFHRREPAKDIKINFEKQSEKELSTEQKTAPESPQRTERKTIKKQYSDSRSFCKVTFRLPKNAAPDAQKVTLAGDFNNWKENSIFLKKLETGDFAVILKLKSCREYRFRYLIDGDRWENDWHADKYIPNSFGSEDSVVVI